MVLQLHNPQLLNTQRSPLDEFGVPELFKRRAGNWGGTYIKVDAAGNCLKRFQGTFASVIQGAKFSQVNDYIFEHGETTHLEFEGQFDNGVLILDSPSYEVFEGIAWDGGGCILFDCIKPSTTGQKIRYFETIMYTSNTSRVRTTQEFLDDQFVGVNFIQETLLNQ